MTTAQRAERYRTAFAEAYPAVQAYVRRRVSGSDADDIVAEALTVLWRRLDEVPEDLVVAWCIGVARRTMSNSRRASGRRAALVEKVRRQPQAVEAIAEQGSDDPVLDAALRLLPKDERELLHLWAWEELAPREIAEVLGVSANAVSIRLHRAKASLRSAIEVEQRKIESVSGHGVSDG